MSDRVSAVVKIRRVYDCPRQAILEFSPSRTKQAPAEACDVNSIMARYTRTGVLPVQRMQGVYADVSQLSGFDYGSAKAVMSQIEEKFMELPANVREAMKNDPEVFMAFVADPANKEKAIELGLIAKAVTEAPAEPEKVG